MLFCPRRGARKGISRRTTDDLPITLNEQPCNKRPVCDVLHGQLDALLDGMTGINNEDIVSQRK